MLKIYWVKENMQSWNFFIEMCLNMKTKTFPKLLLLQFSTNEWIEITISNIYTIFSTQIKKCFKKKQITKKGKSIYGSATEVFKT